MKVKDYPTGRFNVLSFAIALGIVTGLWLLLFAWSAYFWGHGTALITQWSDVYRGYEATPIGGIFGLIWGFVDGFISGLVFSYLYNLCLCCHCVGNGKGRKK